MTRIRSSAAGGLLVLFLLVLAPDVAAAAEPPVRARSTALATLFSDDDYPLAAIRNHEQGAVAFRLTVGPDGRPAGCAVTSSSGSELLDSTTCRLLMERAKFQPARDSEGKAVADSVDGRIVWRLPVDTMDRSEAAVTLWGACLLGEAAKLALTDLPAAELARRAFPPCTALEAAAAREVGEPAPLEDRRAQVVGAFQETVLKARAILKAPAKKGAPK